MTKYEIEIDRGQGGDTTTEAASVEEALDWGVSWAEEGDWGLREKTIWVEVRVRESDTGMNDWDYRTVVIESVEPQCPDDPDHSHDFQSPLSIVGGCDENPGVFGHGGGVTTSECCMRCGCRKLTDTWAQDPATGKEGLKSVKYDEAFYAEQLELADDPDEQ